MTGINGIASLLDKPATERVESLWQELDAQCGLVGVKITPFPHFSWQVTEGYDSPRLDTSLQEIAGQTQPFTVRTAGLGLFSGESPIVYILIVKDEALIRFHSLLWQRMEKIAIRPMPHYAPEKWVPHITLAYNDVRRDNLGCALNNLAFLPFEWEIQIDNLVTIAQTEGPTAQTVYYKFGN